MAHGDGHRRGARVPADARAATSCMNRSGERRKRIRRGAPAARCGACCKIPTLWWIIASGALLNFNMYAIGTFMPAMFGRIYGLTWDAPESRPGIRVPDRRHRGRRCSADGSATGSSISARTGGWMARADFASSARRSPISARCSQARADRRGPLWIVAYGCAEHLLRPGLFVDPGHRRAGAARSHHGSLLHGDVSVRRIVRAL